MKDLLADNPLEQVAPALCSDPNTRLALHRLRDLQREHDTIFAEYIRAKQAVDARFRTRSAHLCARRRSELDASSIQDFWSSVFANSHLLRDNINQRDAVALHYLTDVTCDTVTLPSTSDSVVPPNAHESNNSEQTTVSTESAIPLPVGSFTLSFHFRDNPFFENNVLTKTFVMHDQDFEALAEARGCHVLWKPGKDLTVRTLKKKTKNGRVSIKKLPTDSFFTFFSPHQNLTDVDTDMDQNEVEELQELMDANMEIGECIRSEVIPRALMYFLGIAEEDEDDEDDQDKNDQSGDENSNEEGEDECNACTGCCLSTNSR